MGVHIGKYDESIRVVALQQCRLSQPILQQVVLKQTSSSEWFSSIAHPSKVPNGSQVWNIKEQ